MRVSRMIRLALIAIVVGATVFTVLPANAAAGDNWQLVGTGQYSPGLGSLPQPQTFTFSGEGILAKSLGAGVVSCFWSGNDTIGTFSASNGLFDGSCNTPCGVSSIHGGYNRNVVGGGMGGAFTSGCLLGVTFNGNCVFAPTSGLPFTSYAEVCSFGVG